MPDKESWVTLATTDAYATGALVLGRSLRRVQTTRSLTILINKSKISPHIIRSLETTFDKIVDVVQEIDSMDADNLRLLGRPELGVTLTKIKCWTLTEFDKCVFLDADTLVLKNCDELFSDYEEFSAARDSGWPDCFNSGVFVFKPDLETYKKLSSFSATEGSFDGGDQGLLNSYFSDWSSKDITKHLPFIYNTTANATYSYLPAYKKFGKNVKIVHFIGSTNKPWLSKSGSSHDQTHKDYWWEVYEQDVLPMLDKYLTEKEYHNEFVEADNKSGKNDKTFDPIQNVKFSPVQNEEMKRYAWEKGDPDYMGHHSTDNILAKVDNTLKTTNEEE